MFFRILYNSTGKWNLDVYFLQVFSIGILDIFKNVKNAFYFHNFGCMCRAIFHIKLKHNKTNIKLLIHDENVKNVPLFKKYCSPNGEVSMEVYNC